MSEDTHCECPRENDHVSYEDDEPCEDIQPGGTSFRCTRPDGHDGTHAACGIMPDEHPIATWGGDE